MRSLPTGPLSQIEQEVIAEIRKLRAAASSGMPASLLESPARLAHHFILASHGNVRLRIAPMARELGLEMRTLERNFFSEYRKTMAQYQAEVRLAYSQWLLGVFPPTKISAIASLVGYDRVQDFNRFFKKRMQESPTAWSRKERERIRNQQRSVSSDR